MIYKLKVILCAYSPTFKKQVQLYMHGTSKVFTSQLSIDP